MVFVVKRYAVREAEKWRYAVRKAKIGQYAVRKGGGGVTLISISTEVYITFADLSLDQSKSCIHSWYTILPSNRLVIQFDKK